MQNSCIVVIYFCIEYEKMETTKENTLYLTIK